MGAGGERYYIPVAHRPSLAQRLDLARFYKRRKVQGHMWGFVAFLCLLFFARSVYAAGDPHPTGWDQATWIAFFGVVGLGLKTLDTYLKVRRDARRRTGPRLPLADTSEFVTRTELEELVRTELDGLLGLLDRKLAVQRATLDALGGEVRDQRGELTRFSERSMARFDELRKLILDALAIKGR